MNNKALLVRALLFIAVAFCGELLSECKHALPMSPDHAAALPEARLNAAIGKQGVFQCRLTFRLSGSVPELK